MWSQIYCSCSFLIISDGTNHLDSQMVRSGSYESLIFVKSVCPLQSYTFFGDKEGMLFMEMQKAVCSSALIFVLIRTWK